MNELNNAQIRCAGHIAIFDYHIVDSKQKIWRGFFAPNQAGGITEGDKIVYFSRKYDLKDSDIDRMLEEYEVHDTSIIGVEFLLIPKEKMLFAYQPPSTIIRPMNIVKPRTRP